MACGSRGGFDWILGIEVDYMVDNTQVIECNGVISLFIR
jgi:hypothetical protein